ncbi:MAG TPA: bifunctional diguanylate cyclase/phosphodiesterase [Devosiaceae bacterium]|jgi:diguanylate cyclase (GGDEF)-like protein
MSVKVGRNWQYSTSVVAPVLISVLVVMAGVLGLVLWSAGSSDQRALERETALVGRLMSTQLRSVAHDQESVAVSNPAVINTRMAFDPAWVDTNLGRWMYTYFGHDRTYVLDASDTPVYAMDTGKRTVAASFSNDAAALQPAIRALRDRLAGSDLQAYYDGQREHPPQLTDIMVISGKPAIVSLSPIVAPSEGLHQPAGSEYIHISIMFLADNFAKNVQRQYLLDDANFTLQGNFDAGRAVYPLMNKSGRLIGFFDWRPDRPGRRTLMETLPVLGTAFLIGALAIFLMAGKLWRSSQAIEDSRMQAQHLANHDALTGLPNRSLFEQTLEQSIPLLSVQGRRLTLFMLDLDRFKQVNDTRGHDAGDELIRSVARRLEQVNPGSLFIARIGGDEFAIVSHNCRHEADANILAQRVIDAIGRPFEIYGAEVFIGVSVGIISCVDPLAQRHELVRKADIALYEAKADGRNRAAVYLEHMNELLQLRHTVEAELRDALRQENQLSVAFQPLFDPQSRVIGAEALARWHHPKFGPISPAQFIPVAESAGLIEPLGDTVLRQACEIGGRWPGLTIAVNISPVQLRNPKFPTRVFDMLRETSMRAADLELEITEGILLDDEAIATEALRSFRKAGIRIALDDFGTGYSSLNYLKRYAVDRIKIDRSFISQLGDDKTSLAIVQAMITLAHALGIEVTAEGVETRGQFQTLRDMRCNTFQGYLLSAPIPSEQLAGLFADHPLPLAIRA